jgi:hypothetical protein
MKEIIAYVCDYCPRKKARISVGHTKRQVDGMKETPEVLDKITDVVLAYKPKPKSKAAKKRKRKEKKLENPDRV